MGNPIASSRFFQDLKAFEDEASTFLRNVWIRLHREATPFPERTQHAAPLPATTETISSDKLKQGAHKYHWQYDIEG